MDMSEQSSSASPTPTVAPTAAPTVAPTATPRASPTVGPTTTPSPTVAPTIAPTATPRPSPTIAPTTTPTAIPTATPVPSPTVAPSPPPQGQSVLEVFANAMSPGEFKEFPVPTFGAWLNSYDTAWMTKMYYDPVHNNMWIGGKRADGQGNRMAVAKYDGARNTWSLPYDSSTHGFPLGEDLGHIYEALTVNWSTGLPIFKIFNSLELATLNGSNWVKFNPTNGVADWNQPAAGTAYHPNFFGQGVPGIIVSGRNGISAYNPATDTTTRIAGGWTSGGYTNAINYNPIQDAIFVSKASDGEIYRVRRASEGATRITDTPIAVGPHSSSDMGRLVSAPGGQELIFEKTGNRIWKWVPGSTAAGSWQLLNITNPFPNSTGRWFPEHVYGRGVIWALEFDNNTQQRPPRSYIWKPPGNL